MTFNITLLILVCALLMSCSDSGDEGAGFGVTTYFETPNELHTRADHCMVYSDGSIYFFGGTGFNLIQKKSEAFAEGFVYRIEDESWIKIEEDEQTPIARKNHQCISFNDLIYVWGGENFSGADIRTGAFYDPEVKNWTEIPTTNVHSQVINQSFVSTTNNLFLWGGGTVGSAAGTIYNVETNSWNATATQSAPSSRTSHSTVSTGETVIIWGGVLSGRYLNTGAVYDPTSNTWTTISDTDAPSERYGHHAVWTGEVMLVWGGRNETEFLSDGAAYNPSTDRWEAIAESPLSGRVGHVTVWTGTYMFVWGGENGDGVSNSGAAYNVTSDSWFTIDDLGLTPRIGHRAVWTGEDIVLWGGWDGPFSAFGPTDNKFRNNGVFIRL